MIELSSSCLGVTMTDFRRLPLLVFFAAALAVCGAARAQSKAEPAVSAKEG